MKQVLPAFIEAGRIKTGPLASTPAFGNNGMFMIMGPSGSLAVMISDGGGWEHASVSCKDHVPTWDEMCYVKDQFWDGEECVIEYHPPKSEYVDCCKFCLHLWKPIGVKIPRPPLEFVGAGSNPRIKR